MWYNILIFLKYNKEKINELLDKYGSGDAIRQNADLKDSIDYDFIHGDELIDEVLRERANSQNSAQLQNPLLQTNQAELAREARAVRRAYHHDEDDNNNTTRYADNEYTDTKSDATTTTTDDNGRKNGLTALAKAKETGIYEDSPKFNRLVDSIFKEEGGYEDNSQRIDQPTNMGIIQSTLDNFNKAHPNLKIDKKLKDITREDAQLIYKLDFYDQYRLETVRNNDNSKVLLTMFVMLRPTTALTLLHKSLNDFGYSSKKLLSKEMIPALNQIEQNKKSDDFKELLKSNFINFLKNSPDSKKYKGWFPRIERL